MAQKMGFLLHPQISVVLSHGHICSLPYALILVLLFSKYGHHKYSWPAEWPGDPGDVKALRMAMGCFGTPRLGTDGLPESQRREWDCKHLQGYNTFEEATGSLTDILPGSEVIMV